jgi:hypothetical protein
MEESLALDAILTFRTLWARTYGRVTPADRGIHVSRRFSKPGYRARPLAPAGRGR